MKKKEIVGQVTFVHSSSITEFNLAFRKVMKAIPELKPQPHNPFVNTSRINFITDGKQNLRIDIERQGARLYLRIIAESIGEANLEENKAIVLQIFEQLDRICEELPYPQGKDGKTRRVKLTCEKDYRIEETWYETEENSYDTMSSLRKYLLIGAIALGCLMFGIILFLPDNSSSNKTVHEQTVCVQEDNKQRQEKEDRNKLTNNGRYFEGVWYCSDSNFGGIKMSIAETREGSMSNYDHLFICMEFCTGKQVFGESVHYKHYQKELSVHFDGGEGTVRYTYPRENVIYCYLSGQRLEFAFEHL